MGGEAVPAEWQGGMNMTYRFGGLMSGSSVRMNITTRNSNRRVENVVGIIKGAVESGILSLIKSYCQTHRYTNFRLIWATML